MGTFGPKGSGVHVDSPPNGKNPNSYQGLHDCKYIYIYCFYVKNTQLVPPRVLGFENTLGLFCFVFFITDFIEFPIKTTWSDPISLSKGYLAILEPKFKLKLLVIYLVATMPIYCLLYFTYACVYCESFFFFAFGTTQMAKLTNLVQDSI